MSAELIKSIKKSVSSLKGDAETTSKILNKLDQLQDAEKVSQNEAIKEIEETLNITKRALGQIQENTKDIIKDYNEKRQEIRKLTRDLAKLEKQQKDNNIEDLQAIANLEEQIKEQEKLAAAIKARLTIEKANENILKSTNKFLKDKIGLGYEMNDSFLGSLVASDGALRYMKNSFQEVLKPQKLFASALHQIQKATLEFNKELDTESVNLLKTTGGAIGMNDGLLSMTQSNRRFNASLKETSEIMQALNNNMSLFNQMTLEQKEELIETSIQLKALGVSAETSGKSFDVMINSLGMTQDLAKDATLELIGVANATGMAADVVMSEFNDASSELSKYGANMVKEFKAIAGAAEATGVKISSLMSITKQFDTFEGAATHAGKLNAILGGGVINSMDLLNATEEERVRLLIQSIHASGKNFDNLNRHEKQAIMAAAGITDMNEAQKLFNQSLGEYDMQVERSKAAEKSNKEFEELAQSMVSVSDKLKQIGQSFAVSFGFMIPVVSGLLDMILFLTDNIYKLAAVSAGGLVLGLMAAAKAFQFFKNIVSKGVKSLSKDITEGIGEGLENVAEGVSESVETLSKGIGTAIQTISRSMATSAPMIASAIGTVATAMGTAAAPVGAFGTALATVVLPIAAIVAAVALLVASIALLIYAVISLAKEVGGDQLFKVTMAFQAFALGLGQGLALISASFVAFVATLIAVTYTSMGLVPMLTLAFAGLMTVIAGIALALFALPNEKLINLNIASQGLAKVMDSAVNLTPESVKHTKELVDAAADYVMIQAEMLTPDMDSFVQAMKGAFGGGKSGKGQDIVLVLNDREFGRAVDAAINRSNNLSID